MVFQSFSVFVNNIPPIIHGRWLKQIFQHHGSVMDAYISQKRSKSGKKYGFVRFPSWSEANNAVKKLNGAWLLDHRLDVDFARFNDNPFYWRRIDSSIIGVTQRRSDERPITREAAPKSNTAKDFNNCHYNHSDRRNNVDPIGCNQSISDGEHNVIEVPVQDLKWLEASVVASVRFPLAIQSLQQRLNKEEFSPSSIHPMGGSWFLIRFESKDLVSNLLAEGNSWLDEWFYWIKPWSKDLISDERLAWIRISSLPLHAWNEDVFKQIGNQLGKFLLADDCSVNKLSLDFARILVAINKKLSISNSMEIMVNEDKFSINLEVEHSTDFRLNQPSYTVHGRKSFFPAPTIDSNPEVPVHAKISVQKVNQSLQEDYYHGPPLVSGEAVTSEKKWLLEYDEMIAYMNRDEETDGKFELNLVNEIMSGEILKSMAEQSTYPIDIPNSRQGMNLIEEFEMPSEGNRALSIVQYVETNIAPTDDQLIQQFEENLVETIQDIGETTIKNKKFIYVSAIQSVEDKTGKKNLISAKRKGPKNKKKTNISRKKENKMLDYYLDIPSNIEEEITDEDIRNRNRMLRREAQATLDVAKLLGLSSTVNEEDIIRSLMEAEIEDMARSICRDQ